MPNHTFTNWARHWVWKGRYFMPTTEEEIQAIVNLAREEGCRIRMIGARHSWSDIARTREETDFVVSLDECNEVLEVNKDKGEVRVQAGIRIKDLNDALAKHGLALENLGTIAEQSIAGAISTATHGTGISFSNMATQVLGMKMVLSNGQALSIDDSENTHLLPLVRVSLGCLGIISEVRLKVVSAFRLHGRVDTTKTLRYVLENLDTYLQKHDHFKLWWLPHQEGVWIWELNRTDKALKSNRLLEWFNDYFLGRIFFGSWLGFLERFPTIIPKANRFLQRLFSYNERVKRSDKVLTHPILIRHQEMAYSIPIEYTVEALKVIGEVIEEEDFKVSFPLEIRFIKKDQNALSPMYGRDTCNITFCMYDKKQYKQYFERMERVMLSRFDGRPHWGKMHFASQEELWMRYPRWIQFHSLKEMLDPIGMYSNTFIERLFGK